MTPKPVLHFEVALTKFDINLDSEGNPLSWDVGLTLTTSELQVYYIPTTVMRTEVKTLNQASILKRVFQTVVPNQIAMMLGAPPPVDFFDTIQLENDS